MTKKDFDKLLLESVDEALASLGESVRQAIYFHLEKKFNIAKKDIPHRLKDFADGLEKIFGIGAQFLEILIMKKLYEKVGKPLNWKENEELVFVDYVAVAKQSLSNGAKEFVEI